MTKNQSDLLIALARYIVYKDDENTKDEPHVLYDLRKNIKDEIRNIENEDGSEDD